MTKRFSSLQEVRSAIDSDLITLPSLVDYYLEKIDAQKHLNAVLEVFSDEADKIKIEVLYRLSKSANNP